MESQSILSYTPDLSQLRSVHLTLRGEQWYTVVDLAGLVGTTDLDGVWQTLWEIGLLLYGLWVPDLEYDGTKVYRIHQGDFQVGHMNRYGVVEII